MKLARINFLTLTCRGQTIDPETFKMMGQDRVLRDMLRYDRAFHLPSDPYIIAFPSWKTPEGNTGGKTTWDRWASHGLKLEHVDHDGPLRESFETRRREWVTYRHPRTSLHEGADYSTVAAMSADRFFLAKPSKWREQVTPGICVKTTHPDGMHHYYPAGTDGVQTCVMCQEPRLVVLT